MTAITAVNRWARNGLEARSASSLYSALLSLKNAIGTVWIFALMMLIVTDVLGRWLFNSPVPGVPTIVSQSIVGIVFLQLASTLEAGRITRTTVYVGKLLKTRPLAAAVYQLLFHSLGIAVLGVIAWGTYPLLESAYLSGEFVGHEDEVIFLVWPLKAVIVLGALATAIQFVIFAARDVTVLITGVPQDPKASKNAPVGWPSLLLMGAGLLIVAALIFFGAGEFSRLVIGFVTIALLLFFIRACISASPSSYFLSAPCG